MKPLQSILCAAALLLSSGCVRYKSTEPIPATGEACCTQGDEDLRHFRGCRPTGRCRMNEPYWLRGAVVCTAVDEEECDGGRCCEYREVEDESEETTPADSDPGPVSETNAESGSLSESEADSAAVESDAGEEPDSDLPPFPPVESEAPPVGN